MLERATSSLLRNVKENGKEATFFEAGKSNSNSVTENSTIELEERPEEQDRIGSAQHPRHRGR